MLDVGFPSSVFIRRLRAKFSAGLAIKPEKEQSLPRSICYRSSFHSGTRVKSHYLRVKTKRYIARNLSQNGGCAYSLGRLPYSDWAFFSFPATEGSLEGPPRLSFGHRNYT